MERKERDRDLLERIDLYREKERKRERRERREREKDETEIERRR